MSRISKIILSIGVLIVVGVIGAVYYFYHVQQRPETDTNTEPEVCIQVVTPARNPATGEIKEFPTPCDVPAGWDMLEGGGNESYVKDGITWQKFRNSDLGLSFEYRINPDGYTRIEPVRSSDDPERWTHLYVLMNTKAYLELQATTIAREGPPALSVAVFDNPTHMPLTTWVKTNLRWSLYEAPRTLTNATVGGAPAVFYNADGLYQNDMIAVDNNFKIYVITGGYIEPNDPIRADFQKFVKSLLFF